MRPKMFPTANLPEFHKGLLLVKARPTLSASLFMFGAETPGPLLSTPGLSVLSTFERAGMIKRVVPVFPMDESVPRIRGALPTLFAAAERTSVDRPDAGVSVVELARDSDVEQVQMALATDPHIEYVSRLPVRYLSVKSSANLGVTITAVPPPASTMWNLRKIKWAEARSLPSFKEAQGIKVAVLDTGVDIFNPDLAGQVEEYHYTYPDLPTPSSDHDIIGHGTHVSGTIAALNTNDIGIYGICDPQLYVWKIFDDEPDYIWAYDNFQYFVEPIMYRRALYDCVEKGIDVINLSIGGEGQPDVLEQQAFDKLLAKGVKIVAAMGNSGCDARPQYPAAIPGVIAVGASDVNDTRASFSCCGQHIALCAPGVAVWSTLPTYPGQFGFTARKGPEGEPIPDKPLPRETNYDAWDGTSMATPHVAGSAALLLANKGNMNHVDAKQHLMKTADKMPGMEGRDFTPQHGAGRLNLLRLLSE